MEHWKIKNKQGEKEIYSVCQKEKITTILQLKKTHDAQDEKNTMQQKTIKMHLHIKEKR